MLERERDKKVTEGQNMKQIDCEMIFIARASRKSA